MTLDSVSSQRPSLARPIFDGLPYSSCSADEGSVTAELRCRVVLRAVERRGSPWPVKARDKGIVFGTSA